MRPFIVVLVLLAFGIAVLTTVLFGQIVARHQTPTPVAQVAPPPADTEILVAAHDIKMGDIVKAGDLRYAPWPAAALDGRYVRREKTREVKDDFVSAVARRPLFAGEPMTADAVFRRTDAGVMAGLLSPGMRAVSIPVTATSGVAGYVLPNDHVDILLDQDVHAATGQAESPASRGDLMRYAVEPILSNIRVIAVDDKLAKPDSAANQPGRTVTVEVSPKDAGTLVLAGRMGELVLTLCAMAHDPSPAPSAPQPPVIATGGYIGDLAASAALRAAVHPGLGSSSMARGTVQVNRGGATTTQSFVF